MIEAGDLSEVLAAVGYLGRLTATGGPPTVEARDAHRLLLDAEATGRGPGAAAGRLAGLAYLGDWRTVLAQFAPDDPRSCRIADRAVLSWLPGPITPEGGDLLSAPLHWISERLRGGQPLPAGAEPILLALREKLQAALLAGPRPTEDFLACRGGVAD